MKKAAWILIATFVLAAVGLAEKDSLTPHLGLGRLFWVELAVNVQFRCRRKIEHLLELGHRMNLTAAFEYIYAFLGRNDVVAVEIGGPLLKLGKVLDCLERPLRAEETLDIHAPQRRRIEAMPEVLGPNIAHEMCCTIGMTVGVAVEAGNAAARTSRPAVFGLVELLLRKRSNQQPKALELLGIQYTFE